ncbi:MAG: serine hydrolase domain-containing protein [Balneolaceae bacterium]
MKSKITRRLNLNVRSVGFQLLMAGIFCLTLFSLHSCAVYQPILDPVSQRADTLLTRWINSDEPGASVAIVKNGETLLAKGYGKANLEYDIPVTSSSVFHVASISKQFTAFGILLLEHQGKLTLDDNIRDYLDYIPDFGETITIRHLIHHTSGLRDQWELLFLAGWRLDDVITQNHIVRMISNQEDLNFEPGTRFMYSNTGYTLLAEIIGKITGETFREWTRVNIFEPLEMNSTHFMDNHEQIIYGRAYPYIPLASGGYKRSIRNYANVGAISLYTTAEDMAKWLQNFDTGELGGLSLIEKMETGRGRTTNVDSLSYGYAFFHAKERGLEKIYHGGDDAGFQSFFLRYPDQNFGIVVMGNSSNFSSDGTAHFLARLYLADEMDPVPPRPAEPRQNQEEAGQGEMPLITLFRFLYESILSLFTDTDNEQEESDSQQRASFDENLLEDYSGRFFSNELETVYNVSAYYSYLVVEYRKKGYMLLSPTDNENDRFRVIYHSQLGRLTGKLMSFNFNRNSDDEITGFQIDTERIRNLHFERINENW